MKRLKKFIVEVIEAIESAPLTFVEGGGAFLALITIRILVENWLNRFESRTFSYFFYEFSHTFLFFSFSFAILAIFMVKFLKTDFKKVANVLLLGFLVILSPPIIDHIISNGEGYWSFYKLDNLRGLVWRFFTFFGDKPEIGITYGVRVEVATAVLALGAYSYVKSKNFLKSLFFAFLAYVIFFILGTFPSYVTIVFKGFWRGFLAVDAGIIAEFFLAPAKIFFQEFAEMLSALNIKMSLTYAPLLSAIIIWWLFENKKDQFKAVMRNVRLPQIIFHLGLLGVGIAAGLIFGKINTDWSFFNVLAVVNVSMAVVLAWLASVVVNDLYDWETDKITNVERPLVRKIFSIREYKTIGGAFFAASLFLAAVANFKTALFLFAYQAIAWLYSAWPLRLKRITIVSTFVSAVASLQIFFCGFVLVSSGQNIQTLPSSVAALLIFAFTFSLGLKDFKDIEGDKAHGVKTIPVVFGEDWGRIIVGSGIFASYILSVVLINESRLFVWALICGGASFWCLINKKIHPRKIFWWILGIVAAYGLEITRMLFF